MHYVIQLHDKYYIKTRNIPLTKNISEATQWKTFSGVKRIFDERKQNYREFLKSRRSLPGFRSTFRLLSVDGKKMKIIEEEIITR